jgi:hypothetical protein
MLVLSVAGPDVVAPDTRLAAALIALVCTSKTKTAKVVSKDFNSAETNPTGSPAPVQSQLVGQRS